MTTSAILRLRHLHNFLIYRSSIFRFAPHTSTSHQIYAAADLMPLLPLRALSKTTTSDPPVSLNGISASSKDGQKESGGQRGGQVRSFDFEESELETEEGCWKLYERWIRDCSSVPRSSSERRKRFHVFKMRAHYVVARNKKEGSHDAYGINQFADMTVNECLDTMCLSPPGSSSYAVAQQDGNRQDRIVKV